MGFFWQAILKGSFSGGKSFLMALNICDDLLIVEVNQLGLTDQIRVRCSQSHQVESTGVVLFV